MTSAEEQKKTNCRGSYIANGKMDEAIMTITDLIRDLECLLNSKNLPNDETKTVAMALVHAERSLCRMSEARYSWKDYINENFRDPE